MTYAVGDTRGNAPERMDRNTALAFDALECCRLSASAGVRGKLRALGQFIDNKVGILELTCSVNLR